MLTVWYDEEDDHEADVQLEALAWLQGQGQEQNEDENGEFEGFSPLMLPGPETDVRFAEQIGH